MKYTSKEKDSGLRYFYGGSSESMPSNQIIDILKSDGYVELRSGKNGSAYWITDKGKGLILQGGYAQMDKTKKSQKRFELRMNAMNWIITIIASLISLIGGFILSRMTQ